MPGPLEGIKIVELGTMIAVPSATYLLASQGAEVIKIEDADHGDELRLYGSSKNGMSSWYISANGGKRSIGIDLQSQAGKEILWKVLEDADVMVQGFRPGVVERLGFASDIVRARFPKIVYCSSSGFGSDGPYASLPVYDPVIQALTGWADAQDTGEGPSLVRAVVCDKVAALSTSQAISAALVKQARSGEGQHIEMTMLESSLAFNWPDVMMHCTLLDEDATNYPNILKGYKLHRCLDGWITASAGNNKQWRNFCEAFGEERYADDPRFDSPIARSTHMADWYVVMGEMVAGYTVQEAFDRLREADVPAAPVLATENIKEDPQVKQAGIIREIDHPVAGKILQPRPSAEMFGDQLELLPAPVHGEHTREILNELGYAGEDVEELIADGNVAVAN